MRIKELYTSDSNVDGTSSWSVEKIAKINYNFKLLANNAMSSHTGYQGPPGLDGGIGNSGATGSHGIIGLQGAQGLPAETFWSRNDALLTMPPVNLTINPNNNNSSSIPSHIIIGNIASNNIPTYGWTAATNSYYVFNNDYDSNFSYIATHTGGTAEFHSFDEIQPNIRPATLKINNPLNVEGGTRESIKFINDNSEAYMSSIGYANHSTFSLVSPNNIKLIADTISFTGSTTNGSLNISESSSTTYNMSNAHSVEINALSSLKLSFGDPSNTTVIKSANSTGTVKFEEITDSELEGLTLPIGSIIQIDNKTFNNILNFEIEYYDSEVYSNNMMESTIGRGIGKYKGWYICNGIPWGSVKTGTASNWSSTPQLNAINTPPLNSSTHTFDGNAVGSASTLRVIVGCGRLASVSTPFQNSSSYYASLLNITQEELVVYGSMYDYNTGPGANHTSKLIMKDDTVYIVKLGASDLYQYIAD